MRLLPVVQKSGSSSWGWQADWELQTAHSGGVADQTIVAAFRHSHASLGIQAFTCFFQPALLGWISLTQS